MALFLWFTPHPSMKMRLNPHHPIKKNKSPKSLFMKSSGSNPTQIDPEKIIQVATNTVDGSEIPRPSTCGCIKNPVNKWDKLPTSTG